MADCPVNKIDSNATGLAIAKEACPGVLPGEGGQPGAAVWQLMEPNSYSDFGSEITTVARNPINQSRQNQKGVVTDLEASGGFNQDLTLGNTVERLQEFFFADQRAKPTNRNLNDAAVPVTAVSAVDGYAIANGATLGFTAGQLLFAQGFAAAPNNGLKVATAVTATHVTIAGAVADGAPDAQAMVSAVGIEFAEDDIALETPVGDLPRIVAIAFDFTTLPLIPGEWIFLGGDAAANRLSGANHGFARIKTIAEDTIVFDKIDWAATAQDGTGISLRMFFGDVIRNESDPALIKARSVQLRRTLGNDLVGVQSEYLVGAFANELTVNMPISDKMTVDFGYVAMDNQQRTGTDGLKPGVVAPVVKTDVFNTSSDFTRIKLAIVDAANGNVAPLFGFATEMSLSIANGITMNKALGVMGAFDKSAGNFVVSGSITGYFSTVAAVQAVRNNADVTLDLISVKKNTGMLWDIPLLTLGGGRVTVEQDQPVMVPLENMAAESEFGHTLLFQSFKYLPTLAQ